MIEQEQKTIKVVVKKPNEKGTIEVIENTNEEYQKVIGAEHVDYILFKDNIVGNPIDCIIDDFGIKNKKDINFELRGFNVHGTVIFVERDNEGYFIELSDNSIKYLESEGML